MSNCDKKNPHYSDCEPMPKCPPPMCGGSVTEQLAYLNRKVSELNCEMKQFVDAGEGAIQDIKNKAIYNGAYYDGVVTVEEGWSTTDGTAYKIIRIPRKDKGGCPIDFNLHLAYGNTTNSEITETIFNASEFELADKMFTSAIGSNENGWTGHVRYNGAPLPSFIDPMGYTMGFTSGGRLHWYKNTISEQQLNRDCIKNSMGVTGVMVNSSAKTTKDLWGSEGVTDTKSARICFGQNYENNDIIVLVVGDYDKANGIVNGKEYGMYFSTAADIMAGYCTVAVNAQYGGGDRGVSATDRGQMLFLPSNAVVQENYAFWYISRKSSFGNNYTFEYATLQQLYGQLEWRLQLELAASEVLIRRLETAEMNIAELQTQVEAHTLSIEELRLQTTEIFNELEEINTSITEIRNDIVLINGELTDINTTLTEYNTRITKNETDIEDIYHELDLLDGRVSANENDIRDLIELTATLQSQFSALDNTVIQMNTAVSQMEIVLNEIKQNVIDLSSRVAESERDIIDLQQEDIAINTRIDNEISSRTSADALLQSNINTEANTRATEDTNLSNRITATDTKNTEQDTRLNGIDTLNTTQNTRLTNVENRATAIETKNTQQDTRLTNLESTTGSTGITYVTPSTFKWSKVKGYTDVYEALVNIDPLQDDSDGNNKIGFNTTPDAIITLIDFTASYTGLYDTMANNSFEFPYPTPNTIKLSRNVQSGGYNGIVVSGFRNGGNEHLVIYMKVRSTLPLV